MEEMTAGTTRTPLRSSGPHRSATAPYRARAAELPGLCATALAAFRVARLKDGGPIQLSAFARAMHALARAMSASANNSRVTALRPCYSVLRRTRIKMVRTLNCALLVSAGAALPACGSSSTAHASNSSLTFVKFANCMRSHGVPSFPDPGSAAALQSPPDFNSLAARRAIKACRGGPNGLALRRES